MRFCMIGEIMSKLVVIQDNEKTEIEFNGTPILRDLLAKFGVAVFSPCAGKGTCGKCRVRVSGAVSEPNAKEIASGCRLACQTVLFGDAEAELICGEEKFEYIETATKSEKHAKKADWRYGAAVDIGTTTVALKLFDASGNCIGEAAGMNPQRAVASDVIGRIDAALRGKADLLQKQICDRIKELLRDSCGQADISSDEVEAFVITGNTAMMYLLTGRSPESIARAPFKSETLFGEWVNQNTYIPPCMNAFVGGDITCAVLASGMCESDETALLCDIGTNGEVALWKNGSLYVTSTAAGPAFEGAEISCGCGNVLGAVDKVTVKDGELHVHTVGDKAAAGICGSGIADAVSAFLKLGCIDETGYAEKKLVLSANGGKIELTQEDIRAVQLAKAAIKAGIETLLERSGTSVEDIKRFFIAGGFGNRLSRESAADIGLMPRALARIAKPVGNAALAGAVDMLFDREKIIASERIASKAIHIELGGSADFYENFISAIDFQ